MSEFTGEIPHFRTGYNYDTDAVSKATGLACDPEDTQTQQQFAEDADINTIVRRFGLTGELPPARDIPQYGDFTHVLDYQSALNAVIAADEAFMSLPAQLRSRFDNNPQNLLDFLHDENNREEARTMGLLKPDVHSPPATGAATNQEPKT